MLNMQKNVLPTYIQKKLFFMFGLMFWLVLGMDCNFFNLKIYIE